MAQHPDASIADQLVGVVKRRERVAQLRRDLASACAGLAEAERILWKTVRTRCGRSGTGWCTLGCRSPRQSSGSSAAGCDCHGTMPPAG